MEEGATDHRADGRSACERRRPHADGLRPGHGVGEHVADQRQARRQEGCATDAHDGAGSDERARVGGECCDSRGDAEEAGADEQQLASTEPVAEIAHRDQQAGDEEAVDVDDPQLLCGRGGEFGAQCGDRQVQDGEVHGHQKDRQRQYCQSQPGPAVRAAGARVGSRIGLLVDDAHGGAPITLRTHERTPALAALRALRVFGRRSPARGARSTWVQRTHKSTLYAKRLFHRSGFVHRPGREHGQ